MRRITGNAGGDGQRVADRRAEQRSADPFCRPHGTGFRGVLEDRADHELAQPARAVALTQRAPHDIADDSERLIAGYVVGGVQPVDLEDHDRDGTQRTPGRRNLLLHEHREVPLVVETGGLVEGVVTRADQLVLGTITPVRLFLEDRGHGIELTVQALHVVRRAGEPYFGVLELRGERGTRGAGHDSGRAGNHAQRGLRDHDREHTRRQGDDCRGDR